MISSRKLGPGSRLPTERELAEKLNLSRNTVREAIRELEMLRILDVRRGAGIFVTSLEPQVLLERTVFAVQLLQDGNSLLEILQVRAVLEAAAAEMAAVNISTAALQELGVLVEGIRGDEWSDELLEADVQFHRLIAVAAGNTVMASLLDSFSVRTYTVRTLQGRTVTVPRSTVINTRTSHAAIYESIARRDPKAAAAEAGAHVYGTLRWLRAFIEEQPKRQPFRN